MPHILKVLIITRILSFLKAASNEASSSPENKDLEHNLALRLDRLAQIARQKGTKPVNLAEPPLKKDTASYTPPSPRTEEDSKIAKIREQVIDKLKKVEEEAAEEADAEEEAVAAPKKAAKAHVAAEEEAILKKSITGDDGRVAVNGPPAGEAESPAKAKPGTNSPPAGEAESPAKAEPGTNGPPKANGQPTANTKADNKPNKEKRLNEAKNHKKPIRIH